MAESIGRVPPHDVEAEKSVLGAMMLEREVIFDVMQILRAEDFYMPSHGDIYQGILSVNNTGGAVDLITLSDALTKSGKLESVGGVEYLAHLTTSVGLISNASSYAAIVKEKALLRDLIRTSDETISDAYGERKSASDILARAEEEIFRISQERSDRDLRAISGIVGEAFEKIQEMSMKGGGLTGVTTGYQDLDRDLSGLQASDLVLLAARPSMGKTALGINIATNAAIRAKAKVAIFSLEMSDLQLSQRIISSLSHVDLKKIISGQIAADEWEIIAEAASAMRELPIYIDDTAGITVSEMRAKCRRMKLERGLDLVVIDYLQLMASDGRNENRQQEISAISRGLKALAKELQVPVLALSQLSRAPEARTNKRPMLSDLRESGAIEQDADVVMFIYRDDYYDKASEVPNLAEVIIAKHRNGPTGTVEMVFLPDTTTFADKAREIV